jgi:N-acetylneuraminic acid mutarotase
MKKKRTPQFGSFSLQLVLCSVAICSMITGTLLAFFRPEAPAKGSHPAAAGLTFAERVAYQRAIEDVYWRHRIWPRNGGERPDPKPRLDTVMTKAQLEKKVADYLRKSQALEHYWQRPITAEQLQAEMDRMATNTKQPEVLRELFQALENDPFVIAECLARPVLTERLVGDLSAPDNKGRFDSARSKGLRSVSMETTVANGAYTLPRITEGSLPCTGDSWAPTCVTNAPAGRSYHSAVWTGTEMIVWGGFGSSIFNTGGRYNPDTDSWTATSTTNAPSGRYGHTAVWTGSEMIVWGGTDGFNNLNTGGRYNPSTDSWGGMRPTNAPSERQFHTAVWTGSEMIIWGGVYQRGGPPEYFNTGGRYNPSTNGWTATSTTNAPVARELHTAVWTGNEMIIWGGATLTGDLRTGGRYNTTTDTWAATNTNNAPSVRSVHTGVWTGTEMIVWGGTNGSSDLNTGGRYDPSTDTWIATSTSNAPTARQFHTSVWCGSEMILWGGTDDSGYLNTGGRYNPTIDMWAATSTTNAPEARETHTAVWTGTEMIVWGGNNNTSLNTGGRYGPTPAAMCPPTPTAIPTITPRRPIPTPRPRPTHPPPPPHP